jgi:hypothetical protein
METRAIFQDYVAGGFRDSDCAGEFGVHIAVSVEILIENIYLAPNTPSWLVEVVQAVLNQFGPSRTVAPSALSSPPYFNYYNIKDVVLYYLLGRTRERPASIAANIGGCVRSLREPDFRWWERHCCNALSGNRRATGLDSATLV